MRAGDVLQLRWKNVEDGRLNYQMGKSHKVRDIQIVDDAQVILNYYRTAGSKDSDYIFPFLNSKATWAKESYKGVKTMGDDLKKELFNQVASRNVILNRNLKKIASLAEIEKKISFHTARHTFANMAMREGLSASKIQGLLAHSSVKTTENYMGNFSSKETDEALAQVFKKDAPKSQKEALLEALRGLDKGMLAEVLAELK
jgi:integrase